MPRLILIQTAFLLLFMPAAAIGRDINFRVSRDLPELGLRVHLPRQAIEQPLPPLTRYNYRLSENGREWTEQRFDPREIWYRSQHAGQWRDPDGNLLILARVGNPLPATDSRSKHVSREDFEALLSQTPDLSQADTDAIKDWARDFLGTEISLVEPLRFQPFVIRAAAFLPTPEPSRLTYIFRVNIRQSGEFNPRPRTFAAELRLAPGVDPKQARESFERDFLGRLEVLDPPLRNLAQATESGAAGRDNQAMRRSREDARRSIQNLDGWWYHDTPHYIILSNQHRQRRSLLRDLESDLEVMRQAYAALVPARQTIKAVSVIRIFATPEEYRQYVGEERAWTGGIWDGSRGELVIRPMPTSRSREATERIRRTIYHEAFHQYLAYATKPNLPCAWFNEGHATFFEHASIERGQVVFEEFRPFVDLVGEMPLKDLLALDYQQFYAGDQELRQTHYATAWAFIYYLQRAAAADRTFPFKTLLDEYLQALASGGSGPGATKAIMQGYDMQRLERDYLAFWSSPRRRRFARGAPLPP